MPLYVCDDSAKLEPGSVINPGQVLILPDNGKWFITGIGSSGTA